MRRKKHGKVKLEWFSEKEKFWIPLKIFLGVLMFLKYVKNKNKKEH